MILNARARSRQPRVEFADPVNEVRVTTAPAHDRVAQIVHLTSYKRWSEGGQEQTRVARTALRHTFPLELAALLHHNGFGGHVL